MKIAIEAQRIFRKNKHGMDFVALETIIELQKIDKINQYYIIVRPGDDNGILTESENFKIICITCPTYVLWEQVALPIAIKKIKPDVLHCTSNTGPVFFCKTPLILTLHDIIFLEKRQSANKSLYQNLGWYYRKLVVPRILKKCVKIITVSNFEAARIKGNLSIGQDVVDVVYNGFSTHFSHVPDYSEVTKKYTALKNYFFFLGNTDPKKNTNGVLKGYSAYLKLSKSPFHLLIADLPEEILDSTLKQEDIESIKPFIILSGYIPNSDLPSIYSGAKVFLYPSLRESFGIPILESMACGTPVVTSNISAIPEVAGEGAILINPYNPDEIGAKLLELETDDVLYQMQVEYGLGRVKQFSWKNTARDILKIYNYIGTGLKKR